MWQMMVCIEHFASDMLKLDEVLSSGGWKCVYNFLGDGMLLHVAGSMPGLVSVLLWSQGGILCVSLLGPCIETLLILELHPCYCLWSLYHRFEQGYDFGSCPESDESQMKVVVVSCVYPG